MLNGWRRYELLRPIERRPGWWLRGQYLTWYDREMTARCIASIGSAHRGKRENPDPETLTQELEIARQHLRIPPGEEGGHESEYSCGMYLCPTRETLSKATQWFGWGSGIDAAVVAWGAVAEYERGWRAEHARIEHIIIRNAKLLGDQVGEAVKDLSQRYGVGVQVEMDPPSWESREWMPWWG